MSRAVYSVEPSSDGWTLDEMRKKPNFMEDFDKEADMKVAYYDKHCDIWKGEARCTLCGGRLVAMSSHSIS